MTQAYHTLVQFVNWMQSEEIYMHPDGWINMTSEIDRQIYNKLQSFYNLSTTRELRVSNLGKPWLVNILDLWYPRENRVPKHAAHMKLVDGYWFEAWFTAALYQQNVFNQINNEVEVEYNQPGLPKILGHCDLVVDDSLVIEMKALAPGMIQQIVSPDGYIRNDKYGYGTQLAMYSYLTGKPSCWVFKDKSTSEMRVGVLDDKIMVEAIERVKYGLDQLSRIQRYDIEMLLNFFDVPEATAELRYKKPTGKYYIPVTMRHNVWSVIFYEILEVTEKQVYVRTRTKQELFEILKEMEPDATT